jgi:hypothetical protein
MKRSALILAPFLLLACGGGALTPAGAKVTLNKADPPPECKEAGGVSGYTIGG